MDFSEALKKMKQGHFLTYAHLRDTNTSFSIQFPDEHSKMNSPYIYLKTVDDEGNTVKCPSNMSNHAIMSKTWEVVE